MLALDGAADAHVRAEVLAVRVEHVDLPGRGAEDHQFLAEVVRALDLAGSQLGGEADNEPAGREAVRRKADAAGAEFAFRRIDGRVVESCPSLPSPSARTPGRSDPVHRLLLLF